MYAHWEKGITVHFVGNGYKTSINDKTVTPDKVYSSLPYLSSYYYPSNKAFDSWYTDEALTDKVTASTDFSGHDEITLYAGWRNYQYIVKFSIKYSDKSSVTGSMADVPVDFGVDYIIPECGYSREDYDFVGWSENSYGSTVKYKTGSILNREFVDDYWDGSEDGESFCLYAVWKEDDFSVAFNGLKSALPCRRLHQIDRFSGSPRVRRRLDSLVFKRQRALLRRKHRRPAGHRDAGADHHRSSHQRRRCQDP